jgi:hypothetical protein
MMCAAFALEERLMRTERKCENLTPLGKREEIHSAWLNADINFSSPEGFLAEGIKPELFAEGTYASRLDTINEFPKGAVSRLFDKTAMAAAKKILGSRCCISGNVPSSLMVTSGPKEVKEYCRKIIEFCAPGGGYILSGGAHVDQGNPDNLRAMMEAAKEYGRYK